MKNKNVLQTESELISTQPTQKKFPHLLADLDRRANTSMYYGFTPIKTPNITPDDAKRATAFKDLEIAPKSNREGRLPAWHAHERISMLRSYAENEMHTLAQPVQVYYRRPFPGSGERKQSAEVSFGLEIFGTPRSVGEAIIIQAAYAALRDDGFDQLVVDINSVGDKDAMAKHERELILYYKKHSANLTADFRNAFKCNIFDILTAEDPGCELFRESAPKSVSYLGESGRKHFMEVLEHLETLDIPYRINHALLGNRGFATHAVFEIKHIAETGKETTLAVGSRYNALSRKLGFKKELPAVGITIHYKKQRADETFKTITNPKFYFIQFGDDARLKSLRIIEMLRKERIAVYHSLTKEKLLPQMAAAEELKVPYVLIMGQKEAMENSVVVRNVNTRVQETIEIPFLAQYLRRLK